jgi:hypothetical protein
MLAIPGVTMLPVSSDVTSRWLEMLRRHPVRGGAVFDLQLMATVAANGVERICTSIVRTSKVSLACRFSHRRGRQASIRLLHYIIVGKASALWEHDGNSDPAGVVRVRRG